MVVTFGIAGYNTIVKKRKMNKMSSLSGYFGKKTKQIEIEDRTKTLYKKMATESPMIKDDKIRAKTQGTCHMI